MSHDNDLLFAHSSSLLMSDFGNLAEFDSLSKDDMFLSSAIIEEMADGVLLSGLHGKDDLKPFVNCEADDAFGPSLKGQEDRDAIPAKERESPFSIFIDEDSSEPLEFMNMVAKLESSDPSEGLDMESMCLSSADKDAAPSDSSEECVLPCHKALLAASELDCMSLTPLDLTHVGATDALCAMPPCSTVHSAMSEAAASTLAALPPTREAPPSKNLCKSEAPIPLCSSEMAVSSILQINSPVTSPSSTVSFRSPDDRPFFNMMLRREDAVTVRCLKAGAIPQPPSVLGMEAICSAFGISSLMQPQNSSMQRSQSSHALGQLRISGQGQASACKDDEISVPPSCRQEAAPLSNTSPVSFFTPYQAACKTQGLPESSPTALIRRVYSTGDLQAFHGTKKFYGGNPDNAIAEEAAAGVKIGHYTMEERKLKLHRYRQKRTERNFSKKIKYACRKTLADSRPRVRGRFARTDETESSFRGSDLPLIDEYEEVTSHRPRMVHGQHSYLMANNSCILPSNPIAQFWSTAGMKVAM